MSTHNDTQTLNALVHVLGRIELAAQRRTRCCDVCGCLLLRGEAACPNCAITTVTRRAS